MARKGTNRTTRSDRTPRSGAPGRATTSGSAAPAASRPRWPLFAGFALAAVLVVGGWAVVAGPLAGDPAASGPADDGQGAALVEGQGGRWSEITVDDLDAMLATKDFTLLNVKTPYVGEIDGTDLYIPYDQLTARADELPADKDARLVVYCRSGNQSATAAQILIDLGYTDVVNVDGGMVAWTDSGRQLVQRDRS